MIPVLLATALDLHPFELVRVEDPDYPGADARSATGAVLLEPPPPGVPWSWESVPETDGWPSTEAFEAMNLDPWHEAGILGQGVKVAVFDIAWFGATWDPDELDGAPAWDCYSHPSCEGAFDPLRPRFAFEEGVHGYACSEVIHDIAPEAELNLVRVNGRTSLENAVAWAIAHDIDLISMSLSFFNASFYDGLGSFDPLMDQLAAHDVLMVTSAGNYAEQHWFGQYRDEDHDGRMDFEGDNRLPVYLNSGKKRGVYINWNEHGICGRSDLDAFLLDGDGYIVGTSEGAQDPAADACSPVERLTGTVDEDGIYWLEVRARRVVPGLDVDILATSGGIVGAMPERSIADPGVNARVFTVGAVRADGYLDNDVEGFSSRGPTWGGLAKPDIAGPDGLSSDAYGGGGFYGTSAATPAVTGALALIMAEDPTLTPAEAALRMKIMAVSDQSLFDRPDPRWGAGKARLWALDTGPNPCGDRPLWLAVFGFGWAGRRRRESD